MRSIRFCFPLPTQRRLQSVCTSVRLFQSQFSSRRLFHVATRRRLHRRGGNHTGYGETRASLRSCGRRSDGAFASHSRYQDRSAFCRWDGSLFARAGRFSGTDSSGTRPDHSSSGRLSGLAATRVYSSGDSNRSGLKPLSPRLRLLHFCSPRHPWRLQTTDPAHWVPHCRVSSQPSSSALGLPMRVTLMALALSIRVPLGWPGE